MQRQKHRKAHKTSRKSLRTLGHLRVCAYLRDARHKASLTQVELAEKIGWTQQEVSKVEVGERRIDVAEVIQYAKGAGFEPCNLVQEVAKAMERARGRHTARDTKQTWQ